MEETKILINGVESGKVFHPVYGDDIKVKLEGDTEVFKREKIEGSFRFYGADFDFLESCPEQATLTLAVKRNGIVTASGDFHKEDCTFNYDDRIAEVKLTTRDKYENILANYDKTYNLVRLAPEVEEIRLARRTLLQFYVANENTITNYIGGVSFEETAKSTSEVAHYRLNRLGVLDGVTFEENPTYNGNYSLIGDRYIRTDGEYYIISVSDRYELRSKTDLVIATAFREEGNVQVFYQEGTAIGRGVWSDYKEVYGRFLTSTLQSGGYERPADDICEYNRNYPYIMGASSVDFSGLFATSMDKSDEPTEWGQDSEGRYFTAPRLPEQFKGVRVIPVGIGHWEEMSYWIISTEALIDKSDLYNGTFLLRDAYPLTSVIKVLLRKADESIVFDESESEFLGTAPTTANDVFGTYPFPRSRGNKLYVTPVTNVKQSRYSQAAQRGDITLKQVLDMLRDAFRCFWWIDDNNHLRIEHISYFKRSGSYEDNDIVPDHDATQLFSTMSGKAWDFARNTITYETKDCPSRYEFAWGGECSAPFKGEPIDIRDGGASGKESISVSNFITDIDFIMAAPTQVSDDIFALIESNTNLTPANRIVDVQLGENTPLYRLQNGYLSFLFLEKTAYMYDLSGWVAYAGGTQLFVNGAKDTRRQTFILPVDARTATHIKTGIGTGEIKSLSYQLSNNLSDMVLSFAREKNNHISFRDEITSSDNRIIYALNETEHPLRADIVVVDGQGNQVGRNTYDFSPYQERSVDFAHKSNNDRAVLFSATDGSVYRVLRQASKSSGAIGIEYGSQGITFRGRDIGASDWSMVYIKALEGLTIKIKASSEATYDVGWADASPKGQSTQGAAHKASGTQETTFTLSKGANIYLGYTKDSQSSDNEDKIVFEITKN